VSRNGITGVMTKIEIGAILYNNWMLVNFRLVVYVDIHTVMIALVMTPEKA